MHQKEGHTEAKKASPKVLQEMGAERRDGRSGRKRNDRAVLRLALTSVSRLCWI